MKVAFTTSGDDLGAPLDSRFGRAPKFLVYDLEKDAYEVIDNQDNQNAGQGAGIGSAKMIADAGAGSLVTGHCGPKAFQALLAAGITVYTSQASSIAQALEEYKAGKLSLIDAADVKGHWA
jgi:predicted Fe-Mo cluster-binding NifX family protein